MSDNLHKSENSVFSPIWPEKHISQTYQRSDCLKASENWKDNSRHEQSWIRDLIVCVLTAET